MPSILTWFERSLHILAAVPERADLERRTTELLQRLIQFDTVNPPGNEQAAQEWLRGLLEDAGFECELLADVEGRPNLVARLAGRSDGPVLGYLGHASTPSSRTPPTGPSIRGRASCATAVCGAAGRST
jgi:hypothetical protein